MSIAWCLLPERKGLHLSLRKEDKRAVARMAYRDLGDADSIELMHMADFHVGDEHCDLDMIRSAVSWLIAKPNRYANIVGDLLNLATKNSVSHNYGDMSVKDARRLLTGILEPAKERILCVLRGNHDYRSEKEVGDDLCEVICATLGLPYYEDECFQHLSFGEHYNYHKQVSYCGYLTHGKAGGGKRPGGTLNAVEDLNRIVAGMDYYVQGHSHKPIVYPGVQWVPDMKSSRIVEVKTFYVSVGGALDRGGYPVRGALPPLAKVFPVLILDGTKKKMTAIIEH